jgi:hypothetical protein
MTTLSTGPAKISQMPHLAAQHGACTAPGFQWNLSVIWLYPSHFCHYRATEIPMTRRHMSELRRTCPSSATAVKTAIDSRPTFDNVALFGE